MKTEMLLTISLCDTRVKTVTGVFVTNSFTIIKKTSIPFVPVKGQEIIVEDEDVTVRHTIWNDNLQTLFIYFEQWPISEEDDEPDYKYFTRLKKDFTKQGWDIVPQAEPVYESQA